MRLLAGERERAPNVLLRKLAHVMAVDDDAAARGSRNRRRRFVTVVFPAPLGPTSATRCPGSMGVSTPSSTAGPSP